MLIYSIATFGLQRLLLGIISLDMDILSHIFLEYDLDNKYLALYFSSFCCTNINSKSK